MTLNLIFKRFKSSSTKTDRGTVGEAEMCFFNIFLFACIKLYTLQTKPIFALAILFIGYVIFSSQCELTNIWSGKNIKFSYLLYNLINLQDLISE